MDLQFLVIDLGWVFFVAWGMVLLALGALAFGKDLISYDHAPETKAR